MLAVNNYLLFTVTNKLSIAPQPKPQASALSAELQRFAMSWYGKGGNATTPHVSGTVLVGRRASPVLKWRESVPGDVPTRVHAED